MRSWTSQNRAANILYEKEPFEGASGQDFASLRRSSWYTQNSLEGLYFPICLRTPQNLIGGAGQCWWGEACLEISAETSAIVTQSHNTMDGAMDTMIPIIWILRRIQRYPIITLAAQQEGSGFKAWEVSMCLWGFSPGSVVSSHSTNKCTLG